MKTLFRHQSHNYAIFSQKFRSGELSVIKLYLAALVTYNWQLCHIVLLITPFFLLLIYCWVIFTELLTSTFVSNMTITPGMQDCTPSLSSPSPSWLLIKEGKLSATTLICKTMLMTITTNCNLKNKSGFCYSQWNKLAIVLYLLYFVVTWPFYIIGGDFQLESFSLLLRYEDLWDNFATRPSLMKIMTERLVRG